MSVKEQVDLALGLDFLTRSAGSGFRIYSKSVGRAEITICLIEAFEDIRKNEAIPEPGIYVSYYPASRTADGRDHGNVTNFVPLTNPDAVREAIDFAKCCEATALRGPAGVEMLQEYLGVEQLDLDAVAGNGISPAESVDLYTMLLKSVSPREVSLPSM